MIVLDYLHREETSAAFISGIIKAGNMSPLSEEKISNISATQLAKIV
jgi:hypothetical protein